MKILKSLLFSFQEQDRDTEDYNNDGEGEEWDPIEDEAGSTSRPIVGVTPSAFTRLDTRDPIDFIDPIAATNERPRILDDCKLLTHFHPLQDVLPMLSVAPSNVKCSQDYADSYDALHCFRHFEICLIPISLTTMSFKLDTQLLLIHRIYCFIKTLLQ